MKIPSASAGDNSAFAITDEFNDESRSGPPEYESRQRRGLNFEAIHKNDKNQSPPSTSAFSETWEESPTSKGLLQERNNATIFDRSAIATSNLFHRPSSAGSINPLTTFCFEPANKPKLFQLGRQNVKPVQNLELKVNFGANEQAAISTAEGTLGESAEKPLNMMNTGSIEEPSVCHEAVSSQKEHSSSFKPASEYPEQEDSHDDASAVESSSQHPPCRALEHLEDLVGCSVASEGHSASPVSPSSSKEVINLHENLSLTPMVNATPQHAREGNPRSHQASIIDEQLLTIGANSPSTATGSIERHQSKVSGKRPPRPLGIIKTPTKTPTKTQLHQFSPRRFSGPRKEVSYSEQGPSEEDLLYLLMSRSRETTKSIRKLESVEHQNRQLRQEKILSEARLERAENAQRQLSAKQAIVDQSLETFKEKYYKLKTWALEANKDCEILQNKSVDLHQSLIELTNERDNLRTRLQDLSNTNQNNLGQMDRMRSLINDVRQLATVNIADFSRKDGLLQAKREHLRREQARCEKLEAHIAQIERHKIRQDHRFQDEKDRQNKALREILSELTRLAIKDAESTSESKEIFESVKACQVLLKSELKFGPELTQIKDNIESMAELVSSRINSTVETPREDINNQLANARTAGETEQNQQALLENNAELVKAREEVARLAQIIEHYKVVMELIRNGKQVAEDREAYLKNHTEKLIEALSEGRGAAQKQFDLLKATNDALQIKCQAANAQAAEYKVQNDEKSRQIKLLEIQRGDLQEEKDGIAGQFRKLMEEMLLFKETTKREMDEKAGQSEELICKLRADLDEQTHVRQQAERESMRVNAQFSKVQEELERSQSTSKLTLREKDDIGKRLTTLQQELSRVQEGVRLRDQMQLDLVAKSAEVNDLKKNHYKYEQTKQELISQQEAVSQKTQEVEALASQVETLQRQAHNLEQKAQERDILVEDKANLEKEAQGLKQKLAELHHLRDQLEKQNVQLEESQSALNQAKDDLSQMRKLEEDNKSLKDTLESISAELAIANEKLWELDALHHLLINREEKIRQVEEELATYTSKAEELIKIKADLTLKENELSQLRDRLSTLETEQTASKPIRPVRRAANRSAQNSIPDQGHHRPSLQLNEEDLDPIQATGLTDMNFLMPPQPSLDLATSSQSFVADTLPEIQETLQEIPDSFQPQRRDLKTLGLLESGDTSSLSDIANPFERDEDLGDEHIAYLEEPGASLPSSHGENMSTRSTAPVESATQRPPSSSYGSLNEQMLLDISPHTQSQLEPTTPPQRAGLTRKPQFTRNSRRSVEVVQVEASLQGVASEIAKAKPQRLKSESQTQQRQTTASPERRPETPRDRESTPSIAREKYQPNSAAKRKIGQSEDHQPQKQLKRTPANLEVRIPGTSQNNSQKDDQTPSRKTVTFRRSSVVGTNAPVPGKAQKPSKPARKGSRQERYSSRFGA